MRALSPVPYRLAFALLRWRLSSRNSCSVCFADRPEFDCQFRQQYTPPCPEHVPDPVEHENARSPHNACAGPIKLLTQAAIAGNGA
jgi:hypothetical protein